MHLNHNHKFVYTTQAKVMAKANMFIELVDIIWFAKLTKVITLIRDQFCWKKDDAKIKRDHF